MKIKREIKSHILWNILTIYFDIKTVLYFLRKALMAKLKGDLDGYNQSMAILNLHWNMSSEMVSFQTKNYIFTHKEDPDEIQ